MIRSLSAEWMRLARRDVWLAALAVSAVFAATATLITLLTADGGGEPGPTLATLADAGGGTAAVVAAAGFSSVLILAVSVTQFAGEFSRGTWRCALLHHDDPLRLAAGKFAALLAVVAVAMAAGLAIGWGVAAAIAPSQGISTSSWLGVAGLQAAATDYARLLVFAAGWTLFGTAVGVLTRSVPVGLGAAILWAGPLENVIGDDVEFAQRWFPGLLLRAVLTPGDALVDGWRLAGTLTAYGVVAVAVVAVALRRRDVTS